MNLSKSSFLLVGIALWSLSACVGKKKFDEEAAARQKAESALSRLRNESAADKKKSDAQIADLEKALAEKTKNCDATQANLNALQKNFNELQASYDDMLALNKDLKEQVAENKRQLSERLANKDEELRKKEAELIEREKQMRDLEARLLRDVADREKRVKELEDALAERDRRAKALRESLLKALAGFNTADLSVYERDGKVYVSLSQNLLFAKGSSKLDTKGVSALSKLAAVLNKPESQDINILVEGHTDSDGEDKLNWELSTQRSLAIVQTLIDNNVPSGRLTAAGRGKHAPIAPNDTEANKSKNRRTDIILSPKLDELYKVINGN